MKMTRRELLAPVSNRFVSLQVARRNFFALCFAGGRAWALWGQSRIAETIMAFSIVSSGRPRCLALGNQADRVSRCYGRIVLKQYPILGEFGRSRGNLKEDDVKGAVDLFRLKEGVSAPLGRVRRRRGEATLLQRLSYFVRSSQSQLRAHQGRERRLVPTGCFVFKRDHFVNRASGTSEVLFFPLQPRLSSMILAYSLGRPPGVRFLVS